MARALLVEPQALFAPYFSATLVRAGYAFVETTHAVDAPRSQADDPDVVVIDAGHLDAALRTIAAVRSAHPNARIVVFAKRLDPMWEPLAKAIGADVVIGPYADEAAFLAAVAFVAAT